MAKGVCTWIFDHLLDRGWLKPGEVCVDCFGGIGTTGIIGASRGVKVYCVELESKFVELGRRNFELHRRVWEACGDPLPEIVQGDSRNLQAVLGASGVAACVGSPPFSSSLASGKLSEKLKADLRAATGRGDPSPSGESAFYGQTPGQLASLPAGSVDAVLSSPPYAETLRGDGSQTETAAESRAKRNTPGRSLGQSQRTAGYGSAGNLGNLPAGDVAAVISSPPYTQTRMDGGDVIMDKPARKGYEYIPGGDDVHAQYGQTPGQLGAMKSGDVADAIVSSPPYEGFTASDAGFLSPHSRAEHGRDENAASAVQMQSKDGYGATPGQLGLEQGTTFWEAAKIILAQCHAILRPGGVAVWVVKMFVRNKQLMDFPGDWRRLCESVGFEPLEEIRASLLKTEEHPGLFGEPVVKTKSRKSFFRRLHEKKRPDLAIDYEVVLILKKPEQRACA